MNFGFSDFSLRAQDSVFEIVKLANKPVEELVPKAKDWFEEASEALAPFAKPEWKAWGREWLLPKLFAEESSEADNLVKEAQKKLEAGKVARNYEEKAQMVNSEAKQEISALAETVNKGSLDIKKYQVKAKEIEKRKEKVLADLEEEREKEIRKLEDYCDAGMKEIEVVGKGLEEQENALDRELEDEEVRMGKPKEAARGRVRNFSIF